MPQVDAKHVLAEDQAILGSAASEDDFDLEEVSPGKKGEGKPVRVVVVVKTPFDSVADDSTLVIAWETDTDSGFGTAVAIQQTEAIAEATLIAGYKRVFTLPPHAISRYNRLYFTVAGTGNFTAGIIHAYVEAG